jgi:lipopolysaccharide/colanic/teichoic acid biosynthesis glycosyltransferase
LNLLHTGSSQKSVDLTPGEDDYAFFSNARFHHLLRVERRRTERSGKPFLLLLIDVSALTDEPRPAGIMNGLHSALRFALRETDIRGWYEQDRVIGVILTEIASLDGSAIGCIIRKVHARLNEKLESEFVRRIKVSFHIFPEAKDPVSVDGSFDIKLYPELNKQSFGRRIALAVKKVTDIIGSSVALLIFSPVFLCASAAIKWDSEGPVFFRQKRLGLNGKSFDLLKFRSMYTNCDSVNHQEYIKKYIGEQKSSAVEPGVYKLSGDPRVTPVGRILRKTSLDELPQLINVMKGEMSLVGPRPPIPYECDLYDIWHKRRLLSCKPGITGLWQVMGRSRTTFDEMVRLDLSYINRWSLWLDFKILLMTPKAVLGGKGAY